MSKCIGVVDGTKCSAVATAKVRGSKRPLFCVSCLLIRHHNKISADMIHAEAQRASMAAFKAGR